MDAKFLANRLERLAIDFENSAKESQARNKVNEALHALTLNRYFDSIPIKEMIDILEQHGFDSKEFGFIYTGREGKENCKVGPRSYIHFTWYKMPTSGQYEIVAYVSGGGKPSS